MEIFSFKELLNLSQCLTQYASCGLPLKGFIVDGLREVIIDSYNGILIDPYDIKIYKDRFISDINNPILMGEFSKNSTENALKKSNHDVTSNQYLDVFETV